jgi:hypothetical protein
LPSWWRNLSARTGVARSTIDRLHNARRPPAAQILLNLMAMFERLNALEYQRLEEA